MSTSLTKQIHHQRSADPLLMGGAALLIIGAGVALSSPAVRRFLFGGIRTLAEAALPDLKRYLKLRAM